MTLQPRHSLLWERYPAVKPDTLLRAALPAVLTFWLAGCTGDSINASPRPGEPGFARNTGVQMTIAGGDAQAGTSAQPLPDSLVVRVLDQRKEPVVGGVVNWKVMSGGGSVSQRVTTTDAQGYARTGWTLGTVLGAQTVRASGVGGTVVFTATAGEIGPLRLEMVSGDSQSAQAGQKLAAPLVVRAVDAASGRPLRGVKVSWRVLAGGGSLLRLANLTARDGTASVEWTVGTPGPQGVRAEASAAPPVDFSATATAVVPPPALPVSMHVIPSPIWLSVGDTGRIRVVFLDAQGNVVPGPRPTFISFSSYATVDESGLVRSTVAASGGIEVRAWPFRRFVSVNSWSRTHDRYGSPRNWLYVVPEVTNMFMGDTEQLNALWVGDDGTVSNARDAEWSSLSPSTVSASSTGLATALTYGGAAVYATRGGRTARASVGVTQRGGWCCNMLFDGMTITPAVVSAGAADGAVRFAVYYRHDGPTRLARFAVRVRGPDGRILEQSWPSASGSMTVPRGSPPGRYDIVRVQLVSNGEHVNDVYPSQLEALKNPTYFTVTP